MNKALSINQIEIAIAEINHNLECVIEAQQQAKEEDKKDFVGEKQRLTKLLHKCIKLREEAK